jgi:hypothetical protein
MLRVAFNCTSAFNKMCCPQRLAFQYGKKGFLAVIILEESAKKKKTGI